MGICSLRKIRIRLCYPFLFIAIPCLVFGQTGSDSLTMAAKKRANRMALMSAVVPGLGQIGNKKYWKLPILYGASGTLIYFIKSNNDEYKKFKKALIIKTDLDPNTEDLYPRYTVEDLTVRKDYYRRNRDLCYIFSVLLYSLNIIDAYVDSQLKDFDVTDDLSFRPGGFVSDINGTAYAGIRLSLIFK